MKLEAKQMFAYYQMDYAGLESVSKEGKWEAFTQDQMNLI